ncbi:MAG: radical SAM protein [Geminicoccaceae bacterium]
MADRYLTTDDIDAWSPREGSALARGQAIRSALDADGCDPDRQVAGPSMPVGCVALEITQRCNLDCSLCYLSEHSEATSDLPLEELFRRIDTIADAYGRGTTVQVTGGDPTLRDPNELEAIVARCRDRGLVPALFTNGIRATRSLLSRLAAAGLQDVAFHVDMTQARKGYSSEQELNEVRLDYIRRARGLGLQILFNTTVTERTLEALPDLFAFFMDQADDVHLASFQPQATVGRGTEAEPAIPVDLAGVVQRLDRAAGHELGFGRLLVGHPACNLYTTVLVAGDRLVPLIGDGPFVSALLAACRGRFDFLGRRREPLSAVGAAIGIFARNPQLWPGLAVEMRRVWRGLGGVRGLWTSRFRIRRLSLHVHDFMDGDKLDHRRCEACMFMVATRDGPLSMCVHNAKRDAMILQPIFLSGKGAGSWHPLSGATTDVPDPSSHGLKRTKGRTRANLVRARRSATSRKHTRQRL